MKVQNFKIVIGISIYLTGLGKNKLKCNLKFNKL